MTFGSEETYVLIGKILQQDNAEAYEPLVKILYEDTWAIINRHYSWIREADKEDLVQDTIWKVLKDIPRFYDTSQYKDAVQRNAYLKRIAQNTCIDYIRKTKNSALENSVNIDDFNGLTNNKDYAKRVEDRDAFLVALKSVFQINTTPDKLLAFVQSRLLGALSGKNGSSKDVIDRFDGKPLGMVYEQTMKDLFEILEMEISDDIVAPLKDKLIGENSNRRFHMSAHQIADSGRWIVEKVKEQN